MSEIQRKSQARTELEMAVDKWLASEDGKLCVDGTTSGKNLTNRITMAFLAGAQWSTNFLEAKFDL